MALQVFECQPFYLQLSRSLFNRNNRYTCQTHFYIDYTTVTDLFRCIAPEIQRFLLISSKNSASRFPFCITLFAGPDPLL